MNQATALDCRLMEQSLSGLGISAAEVERYTPERPNRAAVIERFSSAYGYYLAHDIPGRLRLRPRKTPANASALREALQDLTRALGGVAVSARTGSVLFLYAHPRARGELLSFFGLVASSRPEPARAEYLPPARAGARAEGLAERGARNPIPGKLLSYLFPAVARYAWSALRAMPYILAGLRALARGRLSLDALDGTALALCLLRRDFRTVSSITFFFALGEYLSDRTRKKSRANLAESLALNIDHVWIREGDLERRMPLADLKPGDLVVARAGGMLPVDGRVVEGDGMVNQSSLTGEAMPVHKRAGDTVYAGTVLEQGELLIHALKTGGEARINAIIHSIEESESAKAALQSRYESIADAIVPYNFMLGGLVFALTRNLTRAGSVLLVDYSCAVRLATPLAVSSAMREAAGHGALIKGGKFLEALADADVVVFDKTGTLTGAEPALADVIPFGKYERPEVLRLAACLEEHFPHPVGRSVVAAAKLEGLKHRETHARVENIVAHGIVSTWNEQRVLIGSEHFVCADEGLALTPEQREVIDFQADAGRSVLLLAIGKELAGILAIEDKMRAEAPAVVRALRADGVRRVIMLTGDSARTAAGIARRAGVDAFHAGLLPEEKASFVAGLKAEGRKVRMGGDGVNDSPALSAAHVGVAMSRGADVAREIADVVLTSGNLEDLLAARRIARAALARVRSNFRASVFWNSLFLAGSLLGPLTPAISALLHNAVTSAIALRSIRPVLPPAQRHIEEKTS